VASRGPLAWKLTRNTHKQGKDGKYCMLKPRKPWMFSSFDWYRPDRVLIMVKPLNEWGLARAFEGFQF